MRPPFDALDKGAQRIAKGPGGSELVPADMTYYEWLKTQPASFQNDAIGPRRAELLRNGGLSAKRFSELNLGRNFQPLTLKEMKLADPGAFERVENLKKELTLQRESRILLQKDVLEEIGKKANAGWGDNEEWTLLAHPDERQEPRDVTGALREYEDVIHTAEKEIFVALDHGGRFVMARGSVTNEINLDDIELRGRIVTHNHPSGTLMLSGLDVEAMIENGMQGVRAVTPEKGVVGLSVGASAFADGEGLIEEIINRYGAIETAINNDWLKEVAKEYGFIFQEGHI